MDPLLAGIPEEGIFSQKVMERMVFSLKSAVKPSKRSRVLVRKETTAAYLFLLPSLIFILGFVIFPIVLCVWTSFFDSTMNSADVFVDLQTIKNYFRIKFSLER